jgi:glycine cleavage system H protein
MVPGDLRYTAEHEWIREADGVLEVGITDYAQDQLGDVVFVSAPAAGTAVKAGSPCGEVESTKSVSDLYSPVDGEVLQSNDALQSTPELINTDPYGEGWIMRIRPTGGTDGMLDADAYIDLIS